MIKSNAMPTRESTGSRILIFNELGESKFIRVGGGPPDGWSYTDPTLKTVESMPTPEVETHEITQDEMPCHHSEKDGEDKEPDPEPIAA